jgi:hypothetical protein
LPVELVGRWFVFEARGHPNVRAEHRGTFEVTREESLTPRGDCIVGVASEVGASGLPGWLREGLRRGLPAVVVLEAGGYVEAVAGWGDPRMTFGDPVRMVFRRSTYVGPETVMVRASKAAVHLSRGLVEALRRGERLLVAMTVLEAPLDAGVEGLDVEGVNG